MKLRRVTISFLFGSIGWLSYIMHGSYKSHLINELGPGESLGDAVSLSIFASMTLTVLACVIYGLWLLLHSSNETAPVIRSSAWLMNGSALSILLMVWLISGAKP